MTSRYAGNPSSAASSRSSKKLTQPTPRPSARAASHRLATASTLEKSAVWGWTWRPRVCRPPRVRSQVTTMLTGVSRIDSIFSRSKARARAPGSPAADSSRYRAGRVGDNNEVPGLGEAPRRRLMGGREHPPEHVGGHWIGPEALPDVPAVGDHPVHRL